jgi:hypothetical protein
VLTWVGGAQFWVNHSTRIAEFTTLGVRTAPAALIVAVVALWASLNVLGG